MFHDHIWKAMGMKPDQLLCDHCASIRLYRFCPFNDDMGIKRRRRMPHERRRRLYRENVQAGQRDLLERQPRRHSSFLRCDVATSAETLSVASR